MRGWWVAEWLAAPNGQVIVVSWSVWVITSIVLHELAHGWAALRLGDETPRLTGHMTWNPMVHMGMWSFIAFALIGIAWGAMPVNPSRLRGRHGDAIVAAAGPAMNVLLFLVCCISAVVWTAAVHRFGVADPLATNLLLFFTFGALLNAVLAMFNLFPAPPLDGGRIAASFSSAYERFINGPNGQWVALGVFVLAFWLAGDVLFPAASHLTSGLIGLGLSVLGVPPL